MKQNDRCTSNLTSQPSCMKSILEYPHRGLQIDLLDQRSGQP